MHTQQTAALRSYFELMNLNGAARVYNAARETGIIETLRTGPQSAAAIATRLQFQQRPVELLADALHSIGLVEQIEPAAQSSADKASKNEVQYRLSDVLQLLSGEYADLGDRYWDHLPEFLTTGEPIKRMDEVAQSEVLYAKQAASLRWMMTPAAMEAATHLHPTVPAPNAPNAEPYEILDVAAGSAVWSLAAARTKPNANVTAIDWPSVLKVAEQTASEWGLGDRYQSLPGNVFELELPAERYDCVYVANFAHLLNECQLESLFQKLRDAIKPDGALIVVDVFAGQVDGNVSRTLYQLGLEMRTTAGRTYEPEELLRAMEQVGFAGDAKAGQSYFHPLRATPHTMGVVVGKKIRRSA